MAVFLVKTFNGVGALRALLSPTAAADRLSKEQLSVPVNSDPWHLPCVPYPLPRRGGARPLRAALSNPEAMFRRMLVIAGIGARLSGIAAATTTSRTDATLMTPPTGATRRAPISAAPPTPRSRATGSSTSANGVSFVDQVTATLTVVPAGTTVEWMGSGTHP
jgi:hypothetical protein